MRDTKPKTIVVSPPEIIQNIAGIFVYRGLERMKGAHFRLFMEKYRKCNYPHTFFGRF